MENPFFDREYVFCLVSRIVKSGALAKLACICLTSSLCLNCLPAFSAGQTENTGLLAEANRMAARFSYVEAEKLYQKFLSEQPQNSMGHHMYGRMLALQTRYEDALKQYKLSLKLKPNDASVMNDVGVTLSISGFQPLGARFLKQSSLVDSNYPAALNNLGVVLMSLDAYKQASDSFAKSLLIQARNIKIRELKVKADAKVADSKDFDYGLPVSWQDIPDSLKKVEPVISE